MHFAISHSFRGDAVARVHCGGVDHERLTYKYRGRRFRLTNQKVARNDKAIRATNETEAATLIVFGFR